MIRGVEKESMRGEAEKRNEVEQEREKALNMGSRVEE